MATREQYKKAAERLSLCCGVDDPHKRYGMTIATLDGCIEIYRLLRNVTPYVETILQDEADFFKAMGFKVEEPSGFRIAWRIWG